MGPLRGTLADVADLGSNGEIAENAADRWRDGEHAPSKPAKARPLPEVSRLPLRTSTESCVSPETGSRPPVNGRLVREGRYAGLCQSRLASAEKSVSELANSETLFLEAPQLAVLPLWDQRRLQPSVQPNLRQPSWLGIVDVLSRTKEGISDLARSEIPYP